MNFKRTWIVLAGLPLLVSACTLKQSDDQETGGTAGQAGTGNGGSGNTGGTATGGSSNGGTAGGSQGGTAGQGGSAGQGGGGAGGSGGSPPGAGWQKMPLLDDPNDNQYHEGIDRVSGISCESTEACVVITDNTQAGGLIYAASNQAVTSILMSGKVAADERLSFFGFSKTASGRLIARNDRAKRVFSASSDYTNPNSWTRVDVGTNPDLNFDNLNGQEAFGEAPDGTWRYLYQGVLYGADAAPSPTTAWTGLWSPGRIPPFPANYKDLKDADDTICRSFPGGFVLPHPSSTMYMSDDLSLMMYPASAMNAKGDIDFDPPGVCVSTDRGATFRVVAFPGNTNELGPIGLTCGDADHCWAYNGLRSSADSHWIYYTTNASQGMSMTWTRGALPATLLSERTEIREVFFAPDNVHGWAVGAHDSVTMLLRTLDGGASWTDISESVRALADDAKLSSGFALDAQNIWLGGERGFLASNGRGGL
ncbi:MAG: hypothetical protein H6718_24475 [Polyangiaceae bacterium]|nr:hypothetical protein [Myxococcales bacterium]MCB9588588.1 hypothetical protein [Polyangiaceae bacterium]